MLKKWISILLSLVCAVTACFCLHLQAQQQELAAHMIRLHVVANSDDPRDQSLKLKVRDAVLRETEKAISAEDPEAALAESLNAIRNAAQEVLLSEGCEDSVTVKLGKELYPTREYDNFRLPAGVYESLRVNIGKAEGHNWWCVVFPSLCLAASAQDLEQAAQAAGFSDGQIRLITDAGEGYEVRFKILELLGQLKNFLWDA